MRNCTKVDCHSLRGKSALTDLDLEGDQLKATFDGEHSGEEDVHVVERVTVLLSLTLKLNIDKHRKIHKTTFYIGKLFTLIVPLFTKQRN